MKRYKSIFRENEEEALKKLNKIPSMKGANVPDNKDYISTKLFFKISPLRPYIKYARKKYGNDYLKKLINNADIKEIPIDSLIGGQLGLDRNMIKNYIINDNYKEFPIIINFNNNFYIDDGHHRIVAKKLLGNDKIKVRYVEI